MAQQPENSGNGSAKRGGFAGVAGALSSLRLTLILIAVLAAGVLAGTILYGRFGSDYAFQYVYSNPWFNGAAALLALNTIVCVFKRKYLQRRRWGLLFMHLGLVAVRPKGRPRRGLFRQSWRSAAKKAEPRRGFPQSMGRSGAIQQRRPALNPSLCAGFAHQRGR